MLNTYNISFNIRFFYLYKIKKALGGPGNVLPLRVDPRIIKLYQIFPFKMNYGTIRMELWIGCAPYRLTVFVESDHRLHSIC